MTDKIRAALVAYKEVVWSLGNEDHTKMADEALREYDARATPALPQGFPPFAQNILARLRRVEAHFRDGQDADIGSHWLDVLVLLGLLNRVQRSPAKWEITQQGEDFLSGPNPQALPQGVEEAIHGALTRHGDICRNLTDDLIGSVSSALSGMAIVPVDCMTTIARDVEYSPHTSRHTPFLRINFAYDDYDSRDRVYAMLAATKEKGE